MKEKKISRRRFIKMTGAGLAGAAAGPFFLREGRGASKGEVVVCSYGGAYQKILRKAFFDPFEKETGIKVIDTSSPQLSNVKAQVDAKHVEWDVIESGTPWYQALVKQDLVQPIDLKKLDTGDLIPRAALPYGVAPLVTSMAMAYNTKKFPKEHPNTWADFWNVKKFEGPRSFPAEFSYVTEFALLADGVPADKLYPIDLDRAFKKLNELKPHIKVFWKQGDQPIQLLSQGEVVASPAFNGRVIAAQESGFPLTLTYNQAAYSYSYYYIVKGAPHSQEALEFLKFICKARPQADVAMEIPYGPTNKKAFEMIPAARQKLLPSFPENLKTMWPMNGEWLGDHFDELNNRYQKFMLG